MRTRPQPDAGPAPGAAADTGHHGVLTVITVLIGSALVRCGLQLLEAAPWSTGGTGGGSPWAAATALPSESGAGGARVAETLVGVLAAALGAALSLLIESPGRGRRADPDPQRTAPLAEKNQRGTVR